MATELKLPRNMRLRLLKYRGEKGLTIFRDKVSGQKRILPRAFFLALSDLHPGRYEEVKTFPTFEEALAWAVKTGDPDHWEVERARARAAELLAEVFAGLGEFERE